MNAHALTWLAANYHFPERYSCRVPMSSARSAQAMPSPGPAVVRLALIRNAIELFGLDYTRDELFPVIRSMEMRIRPPERVAISAQPICEVEVSEDKSSQDVRLDKAPVYREFAQATGLMTVYVRVPEKYEQAFRDMLNVISCWGRADSSARCVGVDRASPRAGEFAVPFDTLQSGHSVQQFFSCVVTEFRDREVNWDEVMPTVETKRMDPIQLDVYVWPMVAIEQHRGGKLLLRCSLDEWVSKDRRGSDFAATPFWPDRPHGRVDRSTRQTSRSVGGLVGRLLHLVHCVPSNDSGSPSVDPRLGEGIPAETVSTASLPPPLPRSGGGTLS